MQTKGKLLGLEIIRFISAVSVLVFHYQHFFYVGATQVGFAKESQPFYSSLSLLYDYGFFGVQVFWCISGFIFFWKYADAICTGAVTATKFFVLRFSRLYPLHGVTLLLVLALQTLYAAHENAGFVYQNNDLRHFVYQLFLASDWGFGQGYSFNGPIWSISVEVLAYGFFFCVLRSFGRSWLINALVVPVCLGLKYFGVTQPIFDCLAFFYAGGFSSIVFKSLQRSPYFRALSWLCVLVLVALPLWAFFAKAYEYKYFREPFLIVYTPVLLFLGARDFPVAQGVRRVIEAMGNMTYASYLIHFPLQLLTVLLFLQAGQKIPGYSGAFFLGFIALTLLLSHFTFKLFELPAQEHIRKKALSPGRAVA